MKKEARQLWNKDFSMVIAGQIISLFGNAVLRFALPLYILEQSGSAALFGLISALSFLPMILLSPIGGIIADRINKQRIMVALDFGTSFLIFGYIVISGITTAIPIVVLFLMTLYAIQGAYGPAVQSSIPLLVEKDSLVSANAVVNMVTSLSGMIGPMIGGILYGRYGLGSVLIISCICFFLSAVMEMFIHIPYKREKSTENIWQIAKNDINDSVHFIIHKQPILAKSIVIIFLFEVFFGSVLMIGLPVLITQYLKFDSEMFGITQGMMAAGGLMGGILAGILGKRLVIQRVHRLLFICGLCLLPMGIALYVQVSALFTYIVITTMCFCALAVSILIKTQIFAFIQSVVPAELTGKVFSCLMAVGLCAQPIGQAVFGQMFEKFAATPWIVLFGALVVSCAIALYSQRCFRGMR